MLENSRKPRGKRIERRRIEQEIRHHDEWHEDQQSIDPILNRRRHPHRANINGFAGAVNTLVAAQRSGLSVLPAKDRTAYREDFFSAAL